jgi:hypothetical protein
MAGKGAGGAIYSKGGYSDFQCGVTLPGDLAVFLGYTDPARRRNKDHTGILKAHPAHLVAADAARV